MSDTHRDGVLLAGVRVVGEGSRVAVVDCTTQGFPAFGKGRRCGKGIAGMSVVYKGKCRVQTTHLVGCPLVGVARGLVIPVVGAGIAAAAKMSFWAPSENPHSLL